MTLRKPVLNEDVMAYDEMQTDEINNLETTVTDHNSKIMQLLNWMGLVKDYVIESGSNPNGNWEKWNSGKLVQWGQFTMTEDISYAWGSLFVGFDVRIVTFPMPFVGDLPIVFKDIEQVGSSSIIKMSYTSPALTLTGWTGGINPCRPSAATNVETINKWSAIGRWK